MRQLALLTGHLQQRSSVFASVLEPYGLTIFITIPQALRLEQGLHAEPAPTPARSKLKAYGFTPLTRVPASLRSAAAAAAAEVARGPAVQAEKRVLDAFREVRHTVEGRSVPLRSYHVDNLRAVAILGSPSSLAVPNTLHWARTLTSVPRPHGFALLCLGSLQLCTDVNIPCPSHLPSRSTPCVSNTRRSGGRE